MGETKWEKETLEKNADFRCAADAPNDSVFLFQSC